MPESNQPRAAKDAAAKESAAQLHHHETRFLRALRLLVEAGRAKTTEDLIRYAEQDNQTEAANYLRAIAVERVPVELAYDALSVNLRMVAHKRNNSLLQQCLRKQVGLMMPLPPYVIDAFSSLMNVSVLLPDRHHSPLCAETANVTRIQGSRNVRQNIATFEALVFEGFKQGNAFLVDAETADLLDPRMMPEQTLLIIHLRPHQNPDDLELNLSGREIQVL